MRVAVVIRSLNMGGMQRSAVSLAESFAKAGHESHLIYFSEKDRVFTPDPNVTLHLFNLKKTAKKTVIGIFIDLIARLFNGIVRHSYFLTNGLFYTLLFLSKFKSLEKQYGRFDAIIIRGQGTFETLWPIQDPRFFQITVSMFIPSDTLLKLFYFKKLYHNKNVIAISSAIQEKLSDLYRQTDTQPRTLNVIGNPLKIEYIRESANAYEPDISVPYILSVSRITPNKNISLLIDAFELLHSQNKINQHLVIVGTGHDLANIQNRVHRSPYSSLIHLTGQISNPYPWMKKADLFVLSSKFEGLGMVLLEALASGTKVVSTKSKSGVMDIMKGELEDYLCDQTTESMASTIYRALNDGREFDFNRYVEKFSPEAIMNSFEAMLSDSLFKT